MNSGRYPNIGVRSKNELAKRISSKKLPYDDALYLINDVLANKDEYWKDHPKLSEPSKNKWVRNASGSNLGKLLELINKEILTPYDKLLPPFIFGGLTDLNHKAAAWHLLGRKRKRTLLKLDFKGFYEQISKERVEKFFATKAGCGKKGGSLLAELCCVPYGSKPMPADFSTIGRGFSTSSRLAVWCNLDLFLRIELLAASSLAGKDPRIAIYVDDVGITASKASVGDMTVVIGKVHKLLQKQDAAHALVLNEEKTKIILHAGETYDKNGKFLYRRALEHLGLQLNRNKLTVNLKGRYKLLSAKKHAGKTRTQRAKRGYIGRIKYKRYIEKPMNLK